MEESRKQFEAWAYQNRMRGLRMNLSKFEVDGKIYYSAPDIQIQWNAWQASRAVIDIELPQIQEGTTTGEVFLKLINSLLKAGINIKAP